MDEGRRFPRTSLGPGYFIHFRIGGKVFTDMPLVSLGTGGCSLVAPESLLERARKFQILEEVRLDCGSLPATPFKARVAWISGENPSCLGMNFLDLPAGLGEGLEAFVQAIRRQAAGASGT